jgi:hypothetical protein
MTLENAIYIGRGGPENAKPPSSATSSFAAQARGLILKVSSGVLRAQWWRSSRMDDVECPGVCKVMWCQRATERSKKRPRELKEGVTRVRPGWTEVVPVEPG